MARSKPSLSHTHFGRYSLYSPFLSRKKHLPLSFPIWFPLARWKGGLTVQGMWSIGPWSSWYLCVDNNVSASLSPKQLNFRWPKCNIHSGRAGKKNAYWVCVFSLPNDHRYREIYFLRVAMSHHKCLWTVKAWLTSQ